MNKRLKQAKKNHEDWLRSMGIGPRKKRSRSGIHKLPDLSVDTKNIPKTSDCVPVSGNKKKSEKYTGTYIIGIATTHKSNLVPVTSGDQAKEISKMRRQ